MLGKVDVHFFASSRERIMNAITNQPHQNNEGFAEKIVLVASVQWIIKGVRIMAIEESSQNSRLSSTV